MSSLPPDPALLDLTHGLAKVGLSVRPEYVTTILSWGGGAIAAALAGWFAIARLRADKRTPSIAELFARIDKQDQAIADLRTQIGTVTDENRNLKAENRNLREDLRDRDELIDDLTRYVINTDAHAEIGWAPPPPTKTWRIIEHLAEYAQKIAERGA